MENKPKRSLWERMLDVVRPKVSQTEEVQPLEASPETQALATRITEILSLGNKPQELSPEQKAQLEGVKASFVLMYNRYDISKVYHSWRRNPGDAHAQQAWLSMLLGVLTSDQELYDKFNASLNPPAMEVKKTVEVPTFLEPEETAEAVPAIEPELPSEAAVLVEAVPDVEESAIPAEAFVPVQPVDEDDGLPLGYEHLVRELREDPEFYKIVFAMRYDNPSLFNLAAKLAEEPKLSNDLYDFFKGTNFGKQLLNK